MTDDSRRPTDEAVPEQTWGQGEGQHQPTLLDDETDASPGGTATALEDSDAEPARDDEEMDR